MLRCSLFLLSATLLAVSAAQAQGVQRFPYPPTYGLGLPFLQENTQSIRTRGMGGVGMATPNEQYINDLNPAQLAYQPTLMADIDLTYWSNSRTYFDPVRSTGGKGLTERAAALNKLRTPTLRVSYPIINGVLTVGAAFHPKRTYDFATNTLALRPRPVDILTGVQPPADTLLRTTSGTASLRQLTLATGFTMLRTLSGGLQADYLFGFYDAASNTLFSRGEVRPDASDSLAAWNAGNSIRIWRLTGALASRLNLSQTLTLRSAVSATWSLPMSPPKATGSNVGPGSLPQLKARLPVLFKGGLAISDELHWRVGVDGSWQRWSQYRSWSNQASYADGFSLAAGGEIVPGGDDAAIYWQRIAYRAGISWDRTPREELPRIVTQLALSFGASFPIESPLEPRHSSVSVAFKIGRAGYPEPQVYKATTFEVGLGFTFNSKIYGKIGRGNCPIPSCHVRKRHLHDGVEYTGQPWYKKQDPKIGEKLPDRRPTERAKSPKRRQKY